MPDQDRSFDTPNRRKFLKLTGLTAAGFGMTGVASAAKGPQHVSRKTAASRVAAKIQLVSNRSELADWANAKIDPPTTFYLKNAESGPKYLRSAYVFPLTLNGKSVGYVTAAARPEWAPILEYSRAKPPMHTAQEAKQTALNHGTKPTGRPLYHGGVKYGVEAEKGRAVNLRNGQPQDGAHAVSPSQHQFHPKDVQAQKSTLDAVGSSGGSTSTSTTASAPTVTAQASSSYPADNYVTGVPAFVSTDSGGASTTSYGSGPDAWADWDGCSPIAGAMCIGYHEGVNSGDVNQREFIIDHLHDTMQTSNNSSAKTDPWNIGSGISNYTWGVYSYSGQDIYTWNHPNFTQVEVSEYNRPFMLNTTNGGTTVDGTGPFNNHSACVFGYVNHVSEFQLYDDWDFSTHYFTYGNWTACDYDKITTN